MFALALVYLLFVSDAARAEMVTHVTEHFALQYDPSLVSEEEVRMAADRGETFRSAIGDRLGHAPEQRIVVVLHGPARQPDGSWGRPRVDGLARIHLYRYAPEPESFFNAFAHELVHVFRFHRKPHHDWFTEEGFAEFVARRVHPVMDGFPWYGETMDLVAGQFVARGENLPLSALRERHEELNMPCRLQSYALRASFFDWLGRAFGDEKVFAFAAREKAGALEDYERFFDSTFEELETKWYRELLARYEAIENHAARAEAYRTESPAQYVLVCEADR